VDSIFGLMDETLDICKGHQGTVLMDMFHWTFHLVPPAERY